MAWLPRKNFLTGFISGFLVAILLLVGGVLGIVVFMRDKVVENRAGRLEAPPLVPGMRAEYGWSVLDGDGQKHAMAKFEGTPIFLQFWSPSCISCEAAIPTLNKLYEETRESGVEIIAVTADTKAADLHATAQRLNIKYPIYTVEDPVPSVFQFTSGPATFIIDHTGLLVFKHIGASKWDTPAVIAFLRALGITAKMPAPEIQVPPMFTEPEADPPGGQ